MIRYYALINNEKGFEELSETEWLSLIGNENVAPYATKVYQNILSIDEIPTELQEIVSTIVTNKIARWGKYDNQTISSEELGNMIEEVL